MSFRKKEPPSFLSRSTSEPVTSTHSSAGTRGPALYTVLEQCNYLLQLQDSLLRNSASHRKEIVDRSREERGEMEKLRKELERERAEHTNTKCLLSAEEEKSGLALTEVQVLRKQLDREKATFEKAFGLLKSQALCDSTKSESLLAKCSGLESLISGKDAAIARLEGQVHELTERIRDLKQTHKMELQEMNVRIQQEMYLTKHFRDSGGQGPAGSKRTNRSCNGSTKGKLKPPKLKAV